MLFLSHMSAQVMLACNPDSHTVIKDTCHAGSWLSAGYHMGTTIAVPAAVLPLPYAFSQLSWAPGIIALLLATCTTYYSSMLLAGLYNWNGEVYYRYRDLVRSIFGESSITLAAATATGKWTAHKSAPLQCSMVQLA